MTIFKMLRARVYAHRPGIGSRFNTATLVCAQPRVSITHAGPATRLSPRNSICDWRAAVVGVCGPCHCGGVYDHVYRSPFTAVGEVTYSGSNGNSYCCCCCMGKT